MNPFKFNFIIASSFQRSKGFHFSPNVNKPDDAYKFGYLAWSTTQLICDTSVVIPNFFVFVLFCLHFWHKVPII